MMYQSIFGGPFMKTPSLPRAYLLGVLIHTAVIPITLFIAAAICYALPSPTSVIHLFALTGLILSASLSGTLTALAAKGQPAVPLLSALTISMLITLISLLLSGAKAPIAAVINAACYLSVSLLFSYAPRRRNKRRVKRARRLGRGAQLRKL